MRITLVILVSVLTISAASFADDLETNLESGAMIYKARCLSCHGIEGAGDGPMSLQLPPSFRPKSLQSADRKFANTVEKFKELLQKGGPVFGLSGMMSAQEDLQVEELDSLINFVNSFQVLGDKSLKK